ncbi:MAG: hypothetical protein EXS01_04490 [Phycisphaerales bacterium]|nr:hypothetical protein [Phycisphaerales bacterium]
MFTFTNNHNANATATLTNFGGLGVLPSIPVNAVRTTEHVPTTCTSFGFSVDSNGEYRITKRLQRATTGASGRPSDAKREIIDLEVVGCVNGPISVMLNGLPLPSDQCSCNTNGIVTILDVCGNVIDRLQLQNWKCQSVLPMTGVVGYCVQTRSEADRAA